MTLSVLLNQAPLSTEPLLTEQDRVLQEINELERTIQEQVKKTFGEKAKYFFSDGWSHMISLSFF